MGAKIGGNQQMSKFGKLENWKIRKFGNEKMRK